MTEEKIKINLLDNVKYLNNDGTYQKDEAIKFSGKVAGVCYDKEGYEHIKNEPEEKTMNRVSGTLQNRHFSVYGHPSLTFEIQNIPKILAMVINNEKEYNTSEKSARYTMITKPITETDNSIISDKEIELYNKWLEIFKIKIKSKYGEIYSDAKIKKLAQENARYLITIFMPTKMVYTTSLRQINIIAELMQDYINNAKNSFERKLANYMKDFINALDEINVLDERLMVNDKNRNLSLFGHNINQNKEYFANIYSTNYNASLAELAQAQRHRTLDYEFEFLNEKEYFIPPIIKDDNILVNEWLNDMQSVKKGIPQGELVNINETGKYQNFILKCKERLCTEAQLEIMYQTKETLLKYQKSLEQSESYLAEDIQKYTKGARCTFPDYECSQDCKFKEGKTLVRKI
jgi:thymidylate synthase ThyX